MTQKTKLEIIGPYTPEHEGPFCLGDGRHVRLLTKEEGSTKFPIVGYIGDAILPAAWSPHGHCVDRHNRDVHDNTHDLMNAREVSVAREFWLVEHDRKKFQYSAYITEQAAQCVLGNTHDAKAIIHVREVLPGDE